MYRLKVIGHFESAHHLDGFQGKCANTHGHNWKIEVSFIAPDVDRVGIVCDFAVLKQYLKELTDPLDHKYLNELKELKQINPTAENLAKYLFDRMEARLKSDFPSLRVGEVSVWETDHYCATYVPAER